MRYVILATLTLLLSACSSGRSPEPPTAAIDPCLSAPSLCEISKLIQEGTDLSSFYAPPTAATKNLTTPPQGSVLDNLTDEFRNRATTLAYSEGATIKVEPYTTKFGIYDKTKDALPIFGPANPNEGGIDDIPTAPLAAEHWWLSFELLMKGQREYRECVGRISELQRLKNVQCLIDQPCSSIYPLIITLSEYWVPWNAWDNFGEFPAGKLTYQQHFAAGNFGLNQIIQHRNACRAGLAIWRAQ